MADSPRLEELRRRVQGDPASIAFAALAEEYRRAGKFREAVDASRAGLRYHPTYVSARVTLGRSLMELQEVEQAERELTFVLKSAPDNLAARRALGELCWQQLRFADALGHFRTAQTLAPADTELPNILQSLERELAADRASHGANGKAPDPEAKAAEPKAVEAKAVEAKAAEPKATEPESPPQSQPEPAKEAPAPAAEAVVLSGEPPAAAAPAQAEPRAEAGRAAAEGVSPSAEPQAAAVSAQPESSLAPADALAEAVALSGQLESSAEPARGSTEAVTRIDETLPVAAPPEPAAVAEAAAAEGQPVADVQDDAVAANAIVVAQEHAASEAFVVAADEADAVSFVDDSFESHDEPHETVSSEPAADIAYAADAVDEARDEPVAQAEDVAPVAAAQAESESPAGDALIVAEAVESDAAFVADDIDTFSHAPAEPEPAQAHASEPEPPPALASAPAPPSAPAPEVTPVSPPHATTADDRVLSLLEQFHRALLDEQRDRLAAATTPQTSASASPDPHPSRETEHAETFVPTGTETVRSA